MLGDLEAVDLSLAQVSGAGFIPAEDTEEDRVVPGLEMLGKADGQGLLQPAGRFLPESDLGVI